MSDVSKGFDMFSSEYPYATWMCLDDGGNLRVEVVPSRYYRWSNAGAGIVGCTVLASLPLMSTPSGYLMWAIGFFVWGVIISTVLYAICRHLEERLIKHGPVLEYTSKAIIVHPLRGKVSEVPLGGRVVITKREFKGSEHWYDRWTYAYQSTPTEVTIAVMGGGEKCAFYKAVENFCKLAAIPIESVDLGRQPEAK
jgi:hypothetical protein